MKLSEDVIAYIAFYIDEIRLPLVMRGFDIVDKSGMQNYAEKYEDIINDSEMIDPMIIPDLIIAKLMTDLTKLISIHGITVSTEETNRLERLVVLTESLFKLLDWEEYSVIERIISSTHTNEYKLVQILNYIANIEVVVGLEIINDVEDGLFERLSKLIEFRNSIDEAEEEEEEAKVNRTTFEFMNFIGDKKCVGKYLYSRGYNKDITFDELMSVTEIDVIDTLKKLTGNDHVMYAFNILSILMLCSDSRDNPITYFKDNHEVFTDDASTVTKLFTIMSKMSTDFKTYLNNKVGEHGNNN